MDPQVAKASDVGCGGAASLPRFAPNGQFTHVLRDRVGRAFLGRALRGDRRLLRKGAIIFALFLITWTGLLIAPTAALYYAITLLHAFAAAALACNVFHDANHGTFAATARGNLAAARISCALLGTGRMFWRAKHHHLHHQAANVHGWDDDVETRGVVRMSPDQPWLPRHRMGPLLLLPIYALNTIDWVFVKDYRQLLTGQLNSHQPAPRLRLGELAEFFLCKGVHLALVLAPLIFQPLQQVLIGFLLFHLVISIILTTIFQLAHLHGQCDFRQLTTGERITDEWAAHQLRTTVDFATANPFIKWFVGGLNFQVEHHLFPHVCHTHYPEIRLIVRATAAEFGLPYHEHRNLRLALRSHFAHVRALAKRPVTA